MDPQTQTDIGFELLKYGLLLGSAPLWLPFAKALWEEFLLALRADGGLTGPEPTPRERRAIEEELAAEGEYSQVHEPLAHLAGTRPQGRTPARGGRASAPPLRPAAPRGGGPQLGATKRTFRAPTGGAARSLSTGRRTFR